MEIHELAGVVKAKVLRGRNLYGLPPVVVTTLIDCADRGIFCKR